MLRKFGLPFLAFFGIGFSVFMIFWSKRTPPTSPILFSPSQSPYTHSVAGEGIIESFQENTAIGTPFPDLVWEVFVKTGDKVTQGTPLFRLDTRQQEADLKAAVQEFKRAYTNYKNKQTDYTYFQQLKNTSAVSKQQYSQAFFALHQAHDNIKIALARIDQIKTSIARALIIAPKNGTILQVNTRAGEFANINPFDRKPLIIFGDTSTYQLRVSVAEEDAWRITHGAPATAFIRGNNTIRIPLTFEYIEPYIIPKQVLTGSDFERVDTRVLQIVYTFNPNHYPLYIGQLLDAFVEAQPSKTA